MFENIEKKLIILTQRLLVIVAIATLIAFIIYFIFLIHTTFFNSSSDSNVQDAKLTYNTSFQEPELNPVEKEQYKLKIQEAKKSFESRLKDSSNQLSQRSKKARKEKNEINIRYDELLTRTDDIQQRKEVTVRRLAEYDESCKLLADSNSSELNKIEQELTQISKELGVLKDEISTNHIERLVRNIRFQEHCIKYSTEVQKLGEYLFNTFPGDYGFNGKSSIVDIYSKLSNDLDIIDNLFKEDDYEKKKFLDNLGVYLNGQSSYYKKVIENLKLSNQVTEKNAEILSSAISDNYATHINTNLEIYKQYQSEKVQVVIEDTRDWVAFIKGLIPLGVIILLFLAVVFYILFIAIERNQRYLKNLKKEKSQ